MLIFIILTDQFYNKSALRFLIPHCKLVPMNTLLILCFHTALSSQIYVGNKKEKGKKILKKPKHMSGKLQLCSRKLLRLINLNYIYIFNVNTAESSLLLTLCFISSVSEKKKEKEREELWKKLEDLELKRGLRRDGIIPT